MNYKDLAVKIASAEDPYEEFAKEASSMDELHQTTLAREVNKQFFLSRLDDRDGDGNIDFDVVSPSINGTHETKSNSGSTVEKTASLNDEHTINKATLVDDSMFVLNAKRPISAKSFGSSEATFRKTAEHIIDKDFEKNEDIKNYNFKNEKTRVIAFLNDSFGAEVESITKTANDASELRGIIGMAVNAGMSNIVSEIVAISSDAEATLTKVASVDLDVDRANSVMLSLNKLAEISNVKKMAKEASSPDDLEKVAIALTGLGMLAGLGVKAAKGAFGVAHGLGKGTLYLGRGITGTLGAAKGAVTSAAKMQSPLKGALDGFKGGSTKMNGLGAVGITGATALEAGPMIEKYQNQTLGRV